MRVFVLIVISIMMAAYVSAAHAVENEGFFDFTLPETRWEIMAGAQPEYTGIGMTVRSEEPPYLSSPKIDIDANAAKWLSIMARTSDAEFMTIRWESDAISWPGGYTFEIIPDGNWHIYNIPTDSLYDWLGNIKQISLAFVGQCVDIRFAGASDRPMGPAEARVARFRTKEAIARAGETVTIEAVVRNTGGEPIKGLRAELKAARSVEFIGGKEKQIPELAPAQTQTIGWKVKAGEAGAYAVKVRLTGDSIPESVFATTLYFDQKTQARQWEYVPEPKPIKSEYEVGVYYFPGWKSRKQWRVLDDYPARKPLLGYYREGDPEVMDWQIKWMVEHGITFIAFDWYWHNGYRYFDHALHDGYFNARYRDRIKFCIAWCLHNSSSAEDMANVTSYWLDNYFTRSEYFKIDGKPVLIMWGQDQIIKSLGADGMREALEKSREMAKERGLPGIYFIACTSADPNDNADKNQLKALEESGFDALTGYNYPLAGFKWRPHSSYDDMVEGYERIRQSIADNTKLRYIPVSEAGWDARPWHGSQPDIIVRTRKSPAKFRTMLENSRRFVEKYNQDASPKVALIEAWNELGEGDYIEPTHGFGFGYLDAVKSVFAPNAKDCEHILPSDAGLGPYDVPESPADAAWEFDGTTPLDLWSAMFGVRDLKVENGVLAMASTTSDPAIYTGVANLDAKRYSEVEIRMKADKGEWGQLFWGREWRFFPAASESFRLVCDGQYHIYTLDLASNPAWKAMVFHLRLDPTDAPDANIEIDYIRFIAREGK